MSPEVITRKISFSSSLRWIAYILWIGFQFQMYFVSYSSFFKRCTMLWIAQSCSSSYAAIFTGRVLFLLLHLTPFNTFYPFESQRRTSALERSSRNKTNEKPQWHQMVPSIHQSPREQKHVGWQMSLSPLCPQVPFLRLQDHARIHQKANLHKCSHLLRACFLRFQLLFSKKQQQNLLT